jgi:hypothetical protein
MQICLDNRRARYMLFAILALAINAIDSAVIRSAVDPGRRLVLTAAAWFDMVVVVAAVYYWLLVRPGIRAKWSIVPVALAGVLRALPSKALVAGICELALIAFLIVQVRGLRQTPDPVEAIATALGKLFPPRLAAILAAEFGVLYYALCSWRARPHVPAGARAVTISRNSMHRDLLYALALMSVIEVVPAHILLRLWSPASAWIATGLSLYAAVWLIGLARSIELRPVLEGPDYLDVRYGLLFRLRIPREAMARVLRSAPQGKQSAVVLPRGSEPNVWIELATPLEAEQLFGRRRTVTCVALAANEPLKTPGAADC